MRFWDTSALVALFVPETHTARAEGWLRSDPEVAIWVLTRVEVLSAIARRLRENRDDLQILQAARREVFKSWESWTEIGDIEAVRRHAERVDETYALRAADALQIGAALVAAEGDPLALAFVTLDRRLANAAEREGFRVLGAG